MTTTKSYIRYWRWFGFNLYVRIPNALFDRMYR